MSHRQSVSRVGRSLLSARLFVAVMVAVAGLGFALLSAPQMVSAQGCPGTVHKGVCFPQGDASFADATVLLQRGPIGDPPNGDEFSPLGPPDDFTQEGGPPATPNSVSLGEQGILIVQFIDNVLTGSSPDGTADGLLDLWIFETGTATQLVDVAVSADGATWTPVGSTTSQNHGVDLDAFGFSQSSQLFFVRVQDTTPQPIPNPEIVRGADIDAIGAIAALPACNGLTATITGAGEIEGSSGHEVIVGSPGNDVITGSSGHDTICGNGGNDYINGDSGNDWILGSGELVGDSGNDTITAEDANSTIDGGSGTDTCTGAAQIVDCEG